jgi:hypothetical protein
VQNVIFAPESGSFELKCPEYTRKPLSFGSAQNGDFVPFSEVLMSVEELPSIDPSLVINVL